MLQFVNRNEVNVHFYINRVHTTKIVVSMFVSTFSNIFSNRTILKGTEQSEENILEKY